MNKKLFLLFGLMLASFVAAIAQVTVLVPDSLGNIDTLILDPNLPIGTQLPNAGTPAGAFATYTLIPAAVMNLLIYISYFVPGLKKLKINDARLRTLVIGVVVVAGFAAFKPGPWGKEVVNHLGAIVLAIAQYAYLLKPLFGKSNPSLPN